MSMLALLSRCLTVSASLLLSPFPGRGAPVIPLVGRHENTLVGDQGISVREDGEGCLVADPSPVQGLAVGVSSPSGGAGISVGSGGAGVSVGSGVSVPTAFW